MSLKKYIDYEGLKHYRSLLLKEIEEKIEEAKLDITSSLNDYLKSNPSSEIPSTIIFEEDGIYQIKDNSVYPVSHPDLSTQPSILPQRFGNLDIKEVLIANGRENEIPNDATVITAFSFNNHLCCAAIVEKKDNIWSIKNEHNIIPEFTLIQYIGSDKGYYYYSSGEEQTQQQTQEQEIEITPARYLTFKAQADNSSLGLKRLATNHKVYYSKDGTYWKKLNKNITILLDLNEEVYIIGDGNSTLFNYNNYTQFKMIGKIEIYGDITSIIDYNTTDIIIKNFYYCRMFRDCTSLVKAPELPATTLADYCYQSMFTNCTSLVTAPELPATTLAEGCYSYMFYGCTNLVNAPELPATTLAQECYSSMFNGCRSLVTAPELPATTLAEGCYSYMFYGCTNLVNAPELPATTLATSCYGSMFLGCTSLIETPELPATTLAGSCYHSMFKECTNLVTTPSVLSATTLARTCYQYMFNGCRSLVTAPELPATTLAEGCYSYMFNGCRSLNSITCLATDISATDCTVSWVYRVAANGTFTKAASMTSWERGMNGIPTNWTVQDY